MECNDIIIKILLLHAVLLGKGYTLDLDLTYRFFETSKYDQAKCIKMYKIETFVEKDLSSTHLYCAVICAKYKDCISVSVKTPPFCYLCLSTQTAEVTQNDVVSVSVENDITGVLSTIEKIIVRCFPGKYG